jgi:hypothetical protein
MFTYLEKRLRIRPAGVLFVVSKQSDIGMGTTYVSKKLIGDLKMAKAIISCSLREACHITGQSSCVLALWSLARAAVLTSMEQKIHRINVCRTTRADEPMPNPK